MKKDFIEGNYENIFKKHKSKRPKHHYEEDDDLNDDFELEESDNDINS